MTKNLIPAIAQMLGVEIGEEFKVDKYDEMTFKFAENMLVARADFKGAKWGITYVVLSELLGGNVEIIKLPWNPKEGTEVYTFSFTTHEYNSRFCPHKGVWYVTKWNWAGFPWQIAALDKGWVFRSKQEAEAALPAVAAEMGVEYEL